tara:strand:- start:1347 stop:2366 length:1020 start_codon:yes stop_codon:yes gene_type:complete
MSRLEDRIKSIEKLGYFLADISENNIHYDAFFKVLDQAQIQNGWFEKKSCLDAIRYWGEALQPHKVSQWVDSYTIHENNSPKTIAIVTAGNIPLVGLHDIISTWVSGHKAMVKCSTRDKILIPYIVSTDPQFQSLTNFSDGQLENFDAVIATGSNNTARYFDYYFSKYPHIIRKNRNAIAVLNGKETQADMLGLGKDILQYYGLGCRNVSKLYVPKDFDLNMVFGGLFPHANVLKMNKYANNYDYNKAVFIMSEFNFLENGFFMLREQKAISSPIATAYYEFYDDPDSLKMHLKDQQENIQCIVSNMDIEGAIAFGDAQKPTLWDYADGQDTMDFLLSL